MIRCIYCAPSRPAEEVNKYEGLELLLADGLCAFCWRAAGEPAPAGETTVML